MGNGERGTVNGERQRMQPDAKWKASGCYWNVSGRNANDGQTQKERVRVENYIFTVRKWYGFRI